MRKIGRLVSNHHHRDETGLDREGSPERAATNADSLRARAAAHAGGMALFVDYGADHFFSTSLRVCMFVVW